MDLTKKYPPSEKEPDWVRDLTAVQSASENVAIACSNAAEIEQMFAGETICCEVCGKAFPMWPPREWAQHSLDDHKGVFTVQHGANMTLMTQSALTGAHIAYFSAQLSTRVSIRRRAWQLGFTQRVPTTDPNAGGGSGLVDPRGERIQ